MSPLSRDPEARQRQLANLRRGGPPAPPGNQLARKHGAYAALIRERVDEKVAEVFEAIGEDLPLRGPDGGMPAADAAQVRLLAECLVRLDDVGANIRDYGLFDEKTGEMRPAVDLERRLRKEAGGHLDRLGLNPRARTRLGLDLTRAADLSRAMSEPDPDRRRELMLEAGVDPDEAEVDR